ncbi:dTMP kinase [Stigmatella sp. ncwal1]|uniref:Thymidylate kinase n=1 Tax=Stigmatella ashevillensis TaxID=2995309 RepID=A0ABT5DFQ2_9BACT|nr:dTMP kinase [Stigmatella ashevillena]MDC0712497.1 dTMP kinase [Stigmatella ashevillena]
MLIVFEGIDGSGKTTLSNRVAQELRQAGLRVRHVREGGQLASPVSESLRRFTRDPANLALTPMAELLLYAAREAQLLEEVTRPALATHDVVITDRFFYTAEVLARWGRGLPEISVRPVLDACARGLKPDHVFLIDVDPTIARARRKISKIITPKPGAPSRKGLAGAGLQVRLRAGYRTLAEESPGRWSRVENAGLPLEVLVTRLVQDILHLRSDRRLPAPSSRASATPTARSLDEARARFLAHIDRWMEEEPALAAYYLAHFDGEDMAERREHLAARCPELVAYSLTGLVTPAAWRLRRRLAEQAPVQTLGSLTEAALDAPESWGLRELLAQRVPMEVAASLNGLDSELAWNLRERLFFSAAENVVASLQGIGSERAWGQRMRWLADVGGKDALRLERVARTACRSLRGLDGERAWQWRELAWSAAPDAVLRSLEGLECPRSWLLREENVARAPRAVLDSLAGLDHPRAWVLRESFGAQCEEALHSIEGLEGVAAWGLRAALADTWPAAAVKSLGPLETTARGIAFIERLLAQHPEDFALLRHAARCAADTTQRLRHASA